MAPTQEQQARFDSAVLARMREVNPDLFARAEAEVNLNIQSGINQSLMQRLAELDPGTPASMSDAGTAAEVSSDSSEPSPGDAEPDAD
jgi:hypothetical protein